MPIASELACVRGRTFGVRCPAQVSKGQRAGCIFGSPTVCVPIDSTKGAATPPVIEQLFEWSRSSRRDPKSNLMALFMAGCHLQTTCQSRRLLPCLFVCLFACFCCCVMTRTEPIWSRYSKSGPFERMEHFARNERHSFIATTSASVSVCLCAFFSSATSVASRRDSLHCCCPVLLLAVVVMSVMAVAPVGL